jgi:hypothetical protein
VITADTITDEQIRQLRDELVAEIAGSRAPLEAWTMPLDKALCEADWALSHGWGFVSDDDACAAIRDRRRAARARCAEILNARKAAA